ncbi:MAG TPA: portal protein [Allosphingosinicella sp.]
MGADKDDKVLETARRDYERAREAWEENRARARDDLAFARLGRQWPAEIERQRSLEDRPCLTFNKMPAFIRQVVNDARQNKPSIRVHPQDSGADPRTARIINGLIRNIETSSDADVAYDTAIEQAVGQGFGFWRINTRYASENGFEQDIVIERIANPFTVLGDPRSTAADSSDWNLAFIVSALGRDEYERAYPDARKVDWDHDFAGCPDWIDGDNVVVAEYWTRERVKREIVALSDGSIVDSDELKKSPERFEGLETVGDPRTAESWKVIQRIVSGAEVLKTVDWAGQYIPIVPVYGDEVIDEEGRRHFRSLIRDARSAQQMFNYWRTTTTELVALAPKAPFIGPKGTFDSDPNWLTANSQSHAYLEYDNKGAAPQRQGFTGVPAGALQEALNAADDMKSIIGIYDASLGARSNETSGRAILARQREGDVSTFHFIDNLSRAIRHGGRIVLDLIPKVYSTERIIRVLGEDLAPATARIAPTGSAVSGDGAVDPGSGSPDRGLGQAGTREAANGVSAVYDLTVGKYDLTVSAGPSFTTRREEAALQMEAFIQKAPQAAMIIGDLYAKNLDWPGADEIAERLKRMVPPQALGAQPDAASGAAPQQDPALQAQIVQGMQIIQAQQARIAELEQAAGAKAAELQIRQSELALKARSVQVDEYRAETERMKAAASGL